MRFLTLAALALSAIPAVASAQAAPPPLTGPYYVTGEGERGTSLLAMGTRKRDGNRVTITRVLMRPHPIQVGGILLSRIDAVVEYDCATEQVRPLILAARDDKGKLLRSDAIDAPFGPLPPEDGSGPATMKVACDGAPPPGEPRIDDFDAWQVQYFASHARDQ